MQYILFEPDLLTEWPETAKIEPLLLIKPLDNQDILFSMPFFLTQFRDTSFYDQV